MEHAIRTLQKEKDNITRKIGVATVNVNQCKAMIRADKKPSSFDAAIQRRALALHENELQMWNLKLEQINRALAMITE